MEYKSSLFTCGCDLPEPYRFTRTLTCLRDHGITGLVSHERIKDVKALLDSNKRKSNRMFLWCNPGRNMSLKQILNGRPSIFSETPLEELIKTVKKCTGLFGNQKCGFYHRRYGARSNN
uniref:Uncharacterized protein n=1 Tax=Knipowitschia caucasica TaxID=637954 RepID=A0AAV2MH70_KNICA